MDEVEVHNADDIHDCQVFQKYKGEHSMAPVLQMVLEKASLLDYLHPDS